MTLHICWHHLAEVAPKKPDPRPSPHFGTPQHPWAALRLQWWLSIILDNVSQWERARTIPKCFFLPTQSTTFTWKGWVSAITYPPFREALSPTECSTFQFLSLCFWSSCTQKSIPRTERSLQSKPLTRRWPYVQANIKKIYILQRSRYVQKNVTLPSRMKLSPHPLQHAKWFIPIFSLSPKVWTDIPSNFTKPPRKPTKNCYDRVILLL